MTLRVIDVSSNQGNINVSRIDCDAVIVKGTGGTHYVNGNCDFIIQQCFKLNKPTGVYHYAHEYGNIYSPVVESNYFIHKCKKYFGKALIALDYEVPINGRAYTQQDVEWCSKFIQNIIKRTGIIPLLYISKSLLYGCNWSSVAHLNVGLWFAQYASNANMGWISKPWDDSKSVKPFTPVLHQYTSHGKIKGYNGNLDLSLFYGNDQAWHKYAGSIDKHITANKTETHNDYLTAIAKDVIAGKYGSGSERKEKIYNAVQNKVNQLIK